MSLLGLGEPVGAHDVTAFGERVGSVTRMVHQLISELPRANDPAVPTRDRDVRGTFALER